MTEQLSLLESIASLSHTFGTSDYVRGGGGNTSFKNESTLWVKPSGTTLAGLTPETFVALSREKLAQLYAVTPPDEPSDREALVKTMMAQAVRPDSSGRASVEAPLHDSLAARYVVHTHPALVNGMTCAAQGRQACEELFPEALWLDYIDPGFTLCIHVRRQIQAFKARTGAEPALIFLKNHGIFVAADTPEAIQSLYGGVFDRLTAHYAEAGVALTLPIGDPPDDEVVADLSDRIRQAIPGSESDGVTVSGPFEVANGPISPDHIVYSKAYPLMGEPSVESLQSFHDRYGYYPRVVCTDRAVLAIGPSAKRAELALELARDGALVMQLAAAFGGVTFMSDRAREFIENWEVESYRSRQI